MITTKTTLLGLAGLFLGALLLSQGALMAQTKDKTVKSAPMPYSDPTSGKVMFKDYCAACHGIEGKGNGPAAEFLKSPHPEFRNEIARTWNGRHAALG
jgi:mono/diheme cytochrome c family protein